MFGQALEPKFIGFLKLKMVWINLCQFTQNKILQQRNSILEFATDVVISIDRSLREDNLKWLDFSAIDT